MRLAQFVAAMEASPNGVLLLDAGDQIEWCNSRAADHFGLDPQRDRRQRVTNLIRSPAFVAYLQAGNFDEPVTFQEPRGRGSLQVTIRRYAGDPKLVLSQDLTERERTEAMRRDFVANVSHEIRTPLTVLSGFLETMRNLPLTEVEQKRVDHADDAAGRAHGQPGRRPADARPPRRQPAPGRRPLGRRRRAVRPRRSRSARAVGRPARDRLRRRRRGRRSRAARSSCRARSATWSATRFATRPTAAASRSPGGSPTTAAARSPSSTAAAASPASHLSRLTERFYRVDGSRSRESGGTGLGLAIVKHVMQRHGGELDIASEPGKGSTFRLVFPAVRVRATRDRRRARAAGDAPAGDAVARLTTP